MTFRFLPALALCTGLAACAAEPAAAPDARPAATPATAATAGPVTPAEDAAIRAAVDTLIPGIQVDRIAPSPVPGFREVTVSGRVVYVSGDGKYFLQGPLLDIATRENLTAASEAVLRKDLLAKVGPEDRIIFAAGQPKYRVTVFTDIDCGYCRRMHQQVAEYNQLGISIEYLFYPRGGIGSESFDKAVSVWCAPDRRKAMTDAKAGLPLAKATCTNPVTRDYRLGRQAGLDGTPAVYAPDGTQLGGYLEPEEMLARLDELAAREPAKP